MRRALISLLLLLSCKTAFGAVVSYDHVFNANAVYSTEFHTELNDNFDKVANGVNNIVTTQITDDTLTEADMADEINPRIRTYEGANCEYVYTGLTVASGGSLTQNIASGTAYPRGYRINKASNTAKSFTASKWTFVDIDINGDFQYSEVAIDGATPAVATNSIRLARVSTDTSAVLTVLDLRTTSCFTGSFDSIRNNNSESTLFDLFSSGKPTREENNATRGYIAGSQVSYDTQTTFKVRGGGAYINGRFRAVSSDVTVPQTNDNPTLETSGLDTGAIGASTKYYVYLSADKDASENYSISYSTSASTPTGVTNYRIIGEIFTDSNSRFTSYDVLTYHSIGRKEIASSWINFNMATGAIVRSYNVSSITDNGGLGDFTVSLNTAFANTGYVVVGMPIGYDANQNSMLSIKFGTTLSTSSYNVLSNATDGTENDATIVMLVAFGDK